MLSLNRASPVRSEPPTFMPGSKSASLTLYCFMHMVQIRTVAPLFMSWASAFCCSANLRELAFDPMSEELRSVKIDDLIIHILLSSGELLNQTFRVCLNGTLVAIKSIFKVASNVGIFINLKSKQVVVCESIGNELPFRV